MFKNRLIALCITFLCLTFCLPAFAIGQETSTVASWFIHDDPSCIKQDATSQNQSNVVAKLALQEGRASSAATYVIPWSVLNEGGKVEEATSASYRLKDAIGQPVIGKCESANYKAYIGFWGPRPLWIVGVEEQFGDSDAFPQVYSLSQNYPNPMGNVTQIEYALPTASRVSMRIYNVSGQLVKTLVDELQEPGQYSISWSGRDEKGQRVAPGIYFYKFEAHTGLGTEDYKNTKKMILLR